MKTFTTILLLASFIFFKSTSPAADVVQKAPSSLELVLIDEHVVFSTATKISMEMIFRNVGEEKMKPYDLLLGLSVVWDGGEYKRDPRHIGPWNGPWEITPKTAWRNRISLSDSLIPPKLLTSGRHTVAVRDAFGSRKPAPSHVVSCWIHSSLSRELSSLFGFRFC